MHVLVAICKWSINGSNDENSFSWEINLNRFWKIEYSVYMKDLDVWSNKNMLD